MEKKNENKGSGLKVAVLVTVLAAVILAAIVILTNGQEAQPTETAQMDLSGQPIYGDGDAPVTVVEFGDFKCPSCKAWGEMIYPQLIDDYIDSGEVKFSYINVLFHGEESTLASLAAESVYQQSPDAYWDFHKALFAEQPAQNHDALWVTPEKVLEIASGFPSIDQAQLADDMEQQATMEQVEIDEALVEEAEVAQTPTIVVNGMKVEDPFDYEAIKALIEQELSGDQ